MIIWDKIYQSASKFTLSPSNQLESQFQNPHQPLSAIGMNSPQEKLSWQYWKKSGSTPAMNCIPNPASLQTCAWPERIKQIKLLAQGAVPALLSFSPSGKSEPAA